MTFSVTYFSPCVRFNDELSSGRFLDFRCLRSSNCRGFTSVRIIVIRMQDLSCQQPVESVITNCGTFRHGSTHSLLSTAAEYSAPDYAHCAVTIRGIFRSGRSSVQLHESRSIPGPSVFFSTIFNKSIHT